MLCNYNSSCKYFEDFKLSYVTIVNHCFVIYCIVSKNISCETIRNDSFVLYFSYEFSCFTIRIFGFALFLSYKFSCVTIGNYRLVHPSLLFAWWRRVWAMIDYPWLKRCQKLSIEREPFRFPCISMKVDCGSKQVYIYIYIYIAKFSILFHYFSNIYLYFSASIWTNVN